MIYKNISLLHHCASCLDRMLSPFSCGNGEKVFHHLSEIFDSCKTQKERKTSWYTNVLSNDSLLESKYSHLSNKRAVANNV